MPESPSELGQIQSLRRSVTLPVKLNPLAQRRSSVPNTPEHVIYYHPSAKIVHFAPRALAPIPSSSAPSDFDYPVDTIETLPWRSATERTVATAPLRLEKVHGSTAFLKCGNVVHAILKNSQCWCVDGVSKFVLRIRPLTYYRIEIPYETGDDQALVQDLKIALPTVLRYEVTPCPFKRAFSVELPSSVMAPRRKKAWRPKDRRESVPAVLESPLETPSPSSTRSEWVDSASTGDDTDGNLTDDSCFTSLNAKSVTSEPVSDHHHTPSSETLRPSSSHAVPRRSVTETPQTFTSLLAKFQATSASEDDNEAEAEAESEPTPESSSSVEAAAPNDLEAEAAVAHASPALPANDEIQSLETTAAAESTTQVDLHPEVEGELDAEAELGITPERENSVQAESSTPDQVGNLLDSEISVTTEPQIKVELQETPQWETTESEAQSAVEYGLEAEHDASFASSPESFHSAEPQSPDSVSTHPTSVGGHDLPEPTDMFSLLSAKEIISGMESTSASLCEKSKPPALDTCRVADDPTQGDALSSTSRHLSPESLHRGFPDAFSDTSPSMARTSSADQISCTADVSPETKRAPRLIAKAPTLNTDFNHMSSEFRRRAQATRERDISPMPHSSALYKPSPGDDAKSFISKAITLVLIPPAYLFVILLHIAARVVINPPTTGSNPNSKQTNNNLTVEDEFSPPLESQSTSEYEDAEVSRKLDPWDLD